MGNFIRSIKFKIVLAFGLCMSLLVAMGMFSILGLSSLNRDINTMYSMNILPISVLGDIRYEQAMVRLVTRRLMSLEDSTQINESVNSTRALLESIREDWNEYYPSQVSGAEELALAGKLADQLSQFDAAVTDFLNALSSNQAGQIEQTRARMVSVGDAMDHLLTSDVELNQAMAAQFSTKAQSTSSLLINIAIVMVCAGLLGSVFITIYLMRAILRPLGQAIHVASEIAEGKLDNTILVKSMDEFGQLLTALQRMDQHLSGIVREIKSSTDSVSMASQEIASGNLDLSARTEQQAASLEETAASMTQLTETVKQNADNARAANTLASDATGMANVGNDAVQAMVETVDKISASSNKIAEITNLIEGIAFQTNILALNAAVEAARAGEQGRGFAVVASEVRNLAQRSSAAAKEIKTLIDASVSMTRDGSKQAEGVGQTMEQVRGAIQQVAHIVSEIATASSEQSQGIDQVHQAVSQMDDVTQQNAALVEEAAAAAQSLKEQAQHLKQAVSVFRVAEKSVPLNQPRLLRPLLTS